MRLSKAVKSAAGLIIALLLTIDNAACLEWTVPPAYESPPNLTKDLSFSILDNQGVNHVLYDNSNAIIIIEGNYTDGAWDSISSEADTAQKLLVEPLERRGFNVHVWRDLNGRNLREVLQQFFAKYGYDQTGRILFYYYGHGYQIGDIGDEGGPRAFLVPTDSPNPVTKEGDFYAVAMPVTQITEFARQITVKHAFFALEACRAGLIMTQLDGPTPPDPDDILFTQQLNRPSRQIITAGSVGAEVAANLAFTRLFAASLDSGDSNGDGYVTGTEISTFIRDNLSINSHKTQIPEIGNIELLPGNMVFGPVKSADGTPRNRNAVDFLLIADDSSTMEAEQKKLAAAMEGFVKSLDGTDIDYNVCLLTTDIGYYQGNRVDFGTKLNGYFAKEQRVISRRVSNGAKLLKETILNIGFEWSSDERAIAQLSLHVARKDSCIRNGAALFAIVVSDEDERSTGGRAEESSEQFFALEDIDRTNHLINQVEARWPKKKFVWNSIIVMPGDVKCEAVQDNQIFQDTQTKAGSFFGLMYSELSALTGGKVFSICEKDYTPLLTSVVELAARTVAGVGDQANSNNQNSIIPYQECDRVYPYGAHAVSLFGSVVRLVLTGQQAIDSCTEAVSKFPSEPRFSRNLGIALLGSDRRVEGVKLLEAAAKRQDSIGMVMLGSALFDTDPKRTLGLFEAAAKLGSGDAVAGLGALAEEGIDGNADKEKAARLYRLAAEIGDDWGMNLLAKKYETGDGVPKNGELSRIWLEKASKAGNSDASMALALRLEEANPKRAAEYLLLAVAQDPGAHSGDRFEGLSIETRKSVQEILTKSAGYHGKVDGKVGAATLESIQEFIAGLGMN
ncbi:hypothetical protein EN852_001560 [Mesorhizobium sp. M2E.F.Ca.ET.209.01.1.1]|uniref:caspase family protein n=2 Tax=unclassified Mesorhizobium TaxID=325217 RepID=UPI000FDC95BF|nr:caspase family protein [Mesorhizobium sp. M2E.F.Ca.ET.209.01.1.1]TGS19038.1 hypothetical protein EN852_001560 [Mesorhizobium sp. M2E.F.Ca.ET.209.01.1.1]